MSTQLHRTFLDRADRAVDGPDADEVLHLVAQRAGERRHRRRTRIAAGASSLAVVGLVVAGSVALSRDDTPRAAHSASSRHVPAATTVPDGLMAAPPAPATAPQSLGLLPPGWTFSYTDGTFTTYIAPGASAGDPNWFVGKIVVSAETRSDPASAYPLTVAGRPARFSVQNRASWVRILVPDAPDGTELDILLQVPSELGLSQQQVLAMADSIDIRHTTPYAAG